MAIKKYKDFLLEYEGGPPAKDPIKVSSGMITNVELEEEEELDQKEIDILKDFNESNSHLDIDPYGEENWETSTFDYINWNKGLYDFLKQLNNPFIDECLGTIENSRKEDVILGGGPLDGILYELEPQNMDSDTALDNINYRAVTRDINELLELCMPDDEDDEGPDPDEYHDRKRLEEYEDK